MNIGNFAEYWDDVWTIDHSGLILLLEFDHQEKIDFARI